MIMDRFRDYFAAFVCLAGMPTFIVVLIAIYDYIRD
jgi:hypothetical protein